MRVSAIAASFVALLVAGSASAYCRSSTGCDLSGKAEGKMCVPMGPDDCGLPLFWAQPCVGFNVQRDVTNQLDYMTADGAITQAFTTWLVADCGGAGPNIKIADLGSATCARNEYNEHGGNANVLIFHDDDWPHKDVLDGNQDIALTTVTYDTKTGEIYDADIEVNSANYKLTVDTTNVQYDLVSVLTHEVGHFFGLGHAQPQFTGATMQPSYDMGSLDLRDLVQDDIDGICSIYTADRPLKGSCDYVPRHGFASECLADQPPQKCSVSPGPVAPPPWWTFGLVALLTIRIGSRRSSRSRSA